MVQAEPFTGWTRRMFVGGLLFIAAITLAVLSIMRIVGGSGLFSIQTLAFIFALAGIFVLATGMFKGMGGTRSR